MSEHLSFKIYGNGLPLVFLHGFSLDSSIWEKLVKALSNEYKIITIDLPGFGESSQHELPDSLQALSLLVHNTLNTIIKEKYYLFGHSMAGYMALDYIKHFEAEILGLGLIHSHPFEDDDSKKVDRTKAGKFALKYGSQKYIDATFPGLFTEGFIKFNKGEYADFCQRFYSIEPKVIDHYQKIMRQRKSGEDALRSTQLPLYFQLGKQDQSLVFNKSISQVVLAKKSTINIISQVGHMGMIEDIESTQNGVKEFIHFSSKFVK